MKVQWADYFLNSWHRKPESYKVWVCLVGVQVYAIGDTQMTADDCRTACMGMGPWSFDAYGFIGQTVLGISREPESGQ